MPVVGLIPNNEGDYNSTWVQRGGSGKWENEQDGSDVTGVSRQFIGDKQTFFFDDSPILEGSIILDVGQSVRSYYEGGGSGSSGEPFMRLDNVDGTAGTEINNTASAVWYTRTGLARPGGGSWTWQDVKGDFEAGITYTATAPTGANFFLAQFRARINYAAPTGTFVFFMFEYLLPVVGAVGTLSSTEWARVRTHLELRNRHWFTNEEWTRGVRELLAYRAPAFAL